MLESNNGESSFPDEPEIEISDLPGSSAGFSGAPRPRRTSLGPRFSPRQRRRQAFITSAFILIALAVLLLSASPVRELAARRFATPSPTPGLLSGNNLFYFQDLPSWGKISIDGKALAKAPTVDSAPPLRLPGGLHRVTWQAQPFKPLQCVLSVPADPERQTCRTRPTGTNEYTRNATLVEFPTAPSLDLLPTVQQQALTQNIQDVLDQLQSTTTVQKGEYYAYNQAAPSPEIAARPLQATLRFLLDTDSSEPGLCMGPRFGTACSIGENDCRRFCTLTWPQDGITPATPAWHIAAIVRPTWQYEPQQKALSTPTMGDQYFVTFRVEWRQGRWLVSFHPQGASSFDDPNCIAAIGMIMSNPGYLFIDRTQQRVTWTFSSGPNRALGCLARATLHDATLQLPLSQENDAYVLYRFGVLLSANDNAHRLWQNLPQASSSVQSIASEIARHPTFVS